MNNINLQGRLIKDPEIRYAQDDKAIAKYCLAVKREFFKQGDTDTDFINCVAFGKSAEFVEKYLKKGQLILINGTLRTGFYEKDNIRFYTADIIVNKHYFCGSKSDNNNNNTNNDDSNYSTAPKANNQGFTNITIDDLEDLPF